MEEIEVSEQSSDLSLVGLEKVFVQVEHRPNSEQIGTSVNIREQVHDFIGESYELVTMAEASRRLKMPYPTLRRQVLAGKIASTQGPDGKPLVKLSSTEYSTKSTEQKVNKTEQRQSPTEHSLTIQRLMEQMEVERQYSRTLNEKLEAANHRNGYLEAQVDLQTQQIKLLTDHRQNRNALSRFWRWFTGS